MVPVGVPLVGAPALQITVLALLPIPCPSSAALELLARIAAIRMRIHRPDVFEVISPALQLMDAVTQASECRVFSEGISQSSKEEE